MIGAFSHKKVYSFQMQCANGNGGGEIQTVQPLVETDAAVITFSVSISWAWITRVELSLQPEGIME